MAEERTKRVEKVIKGSAVPTKPSIGRKFADLFLGDHISNVKEYMLYDRIIPGIKEMFLAGIEMMLFGGDRVLRRDPRNSKVGYISYNKMYASSPSRREREHGYRYEREEVRRNE